MTAFSFMSFEAEANKLTGGKTQPRFGQAAVLRKIWAVTVETARVESTRARTTTMGAVECKVSG